ncbi:hypothetical protein BGV47_32060 [Burkholderia ubonensis]|uniref:hypothetical protein n=1 Tax=Burkholderia ubonensis TaxID=101571 RepID=UPI000918CBC3|nr:hypothetical protein [Burkholderia ubonensis]OJA23531.1 hypothetical protein BGV47_32060 [Burkholderia ubonensis]
MKGDVKPLDPPVVEEAQGDVLDPDRSATVRVDDYGFMEEGDVVRLRWMGTKSNNDPTLYTATRPITENTKGRPVRFPIPPEELSVLNGGTVLVTYSVYPIAGNGPFEPREGTRYRVGEAGALLPPPEVDYLDVGSGVLDPDRVPEWGTFLTVPKAANTMRGDDVTVYWRGRTGGPSDSFEDRLPVSDATAGDALPFPIEKWLVTANLDANVTARYVIMRDGEPLPSEPRTFRVGAAQVELDAPRIKEATGATLDPAAARDALTAVVEYDNEPDDKVKVTWTGNGAAGSTTTAWIDVGSVPLEIPLDKGVVAFNLGRTVSVSYEVQRNGQTLGSSDALPLSVGALSENALLPSKPKILEAQGNGDGTELDLGNVTGGATVHIDNWPLIAVGQRVWLWLRGKTSDGSTHDLPLWMSAAVNGSEVDRGYLEKVAPYSYLQELGDGSALTVEFEATFDQSTDEANAVPFPLRTYTVKAVPDVVPTIETLKDDLNRDIGQDASVVTASISLTGTAAAGQEVEILNGQTLLTTVSAPGGNWSAPNLPVSAGSSYSLTARGKYGSNPESTPPRTFTVASPLAVGPETVHLDTTRYYVFIHDTWEVPPPSYWPEEVYNVPVTGGVPPYYFTITAASGEKVIRVSETGQILPWRNSGWAHVTVSDSAGNSLVIQVGTTHLWQYQQAANRVTRTQADTYLAQKGLKMPNRAQMHDFYSRFAVAGANVCTTIGIQNNGPSDSTCWFWEDEIHSTNRWWFRNLGDGAEGGINLASQINCIGYKQG